MIYKEVKESNTIFFNPYAQLIQCFKMLDMFDENFYRMWEFYLTSCEMVFKWGDQVVFQFQLTKDLKSVPTTRDYIY